MNLASKLRQVGVALENIPVAIAPEPTVVVDQPFAVEDSVDQLQQTSQIVDTLETDLSQVETAEDQLGRVATALEAFNDGRGLSRADFGVFRASVESICAGLGLRNDVAAVENFNGGTARQQALNVSLEDVKEKIATLKKWAVEMWAAFTKWLGEYWTKLFDSVAKLKARAEALKEKALAASGGSRNEKITLPASHAANLSLKQSYVREPMASAAFLVTLVEAEIEKINPKQIEAVKTLSGLMEAGKDDGIENIFEDIVASYRQLPGTNWSIDGDFAVSEEMIGGWGYRLSVPERKVTLARMYPVQEEEIEVATLRSDKVATLCDIVIDLCSILEKGRSELESRADLADSFRSKVSSFQAEDENQTILVRTIMKSQTELLRGTLKQLTGYAVGVANSMLVLCARSLDAHEQTEVKAIPA